MTDIYLVWPTPLLPSGTVEFDPRLLPHIAALGVKGVRVNLHPRSEHNDRIVTETRQTGLAVWPVLDLDYDGSLPTARYAEWCLDIVSRYQFRGVELGNEPWTMHRMSAPLYAQYVLAASTALRTRADRVVITIAGDALRPGGRRDARWEDWWQEVRSGLPFNVWDQAALHTYRFGAMPPSSSRIEWPEWIHRFPPNIGRNLFGEADMRSAEYVWWRQQVHAPMVVTETGWSRQYVSDAINALYLREELEFWLARRMAMVCIYAYGGPDWGVLNEDGSPRPQAEAIRQFIEAHEGTHPQHI